MPFLSGTLRKGEGKCFTLNGKDIHSSGNFFFFLLCTPVGNLIITCPEIVQIEGTRLLTKFSAEVKTA